MSKAKFKYAIREAQSKSKQKEFGIEKSKYPRFRTNSDDLDFQSISCMITKRGQGLNFKNMITEMIAGQKANSSLNLII